MSQNAEGDNTGNTRNQIESKMDDDQRRAHDRLNVFAGHWNKEGEAVEGPFGPAGKLTGVESYEWFTGGFFLIHRLDGHLGEAEIACVEIIGYDQSSGNWKAETFYNDGNSAIWEVSERDGVWTYAGGWDVKGEAFKVRCLCEFSDDRNVMTGRWEYSRDGARWQIFWDTKLTRSRG